MGLIDIDYFPRNGGPYHLPETHRSAEAPQAAEHPHPRPRLELDLQAAGLLAEPSRAGLQPGPCSARGPSLFRPDRDLRCAGGRSNPSLHLGSPPAGDRDRVSDRNHPLPDHPSDLPLTRLIPPRAPSAATRPSWESPDHCIRLFAGRGRHDDVQNFHQLVGRNETGPMADHLSGFGKKP